MALVHIYSLSSLGDRLGDRPCDDGQTQTRSRSNHPRLGMVCIDLFDPFGETDRAAARRARWARRGL